MPPFMRREKVLVVLHSDGFVECFAEQHIDCNIVNAPLAKTIADDRLVDENLALLIPRTYRDLHWPNKLRATAIHRKITAGEILWCDTRVAILRGVDEIGRALADMDVRREITNV